MTEHFTYDFNSDKSKMRVYYPDGTELNNSPVTDSSQGWEIPVDVLPVLVQELQQEFQDYGFTQTAMDLILAIADTNRLVKE